MNSTNETFYSLAYWYDLFGFSYIVDILYFYVSTPISLVSFCLNITSFYVLNKKPFLKSKFFTYMRLYVLSNTFLSLLLTTTFIMGTHNIFEFTNSYECIFYGTYIFACFQSALLLFSSLLEILMIIERSLYFLPVRFKTIK